MRAVGILAFLLPLALAAAAWGAEDPVVARVNGVEIRKSALDRAYAGLPEQYRQVPQQVLLRPLLDRVIDDELLRAEAERRELAADPEVRAAIARARAEVLRTALLERIVNEASTDEKLRAAYEEMKKEPDFAREEARLRHILVATEEEAKKLIAELDAGADFAELARAHSTGPSAQRGGDLGWMRKDQLVLEFATAAFALEPGTYTKTPVQTRFGWHVIRLEEKRTKIPSFEEVQDKVRLRVARAAIRDFVEELRQSAEIERYEEALGLSEQAPKEE